MDKSSFSFNNWDKGQPQNTSNTNCGAIKFSYGKWIADDCLKLKPFICMAKVKQAPSPPLTLATTTPPPKPKTCPESWTLSKLTGFCYKVYFNSTWADAETLCVTQNSHLASIHSIEEGLFIANLLPNINMIDYCDDIVQTWIGLYTQDNNAHYYWTDGTPVDYLFWAVNQPDYTGIENCGQLRKYPVCGGTVLGDFNNFRCNNVVQHFVCKKPAS
uniref:C-type lectin domain-containing protein n=1 Tax=Panagrolaimus davidi TaxID=227884 RepID=A0A914P9G6_9BILA